MRAIKLILPLTISSIAAWVPVWGQNHFSLNASTVALWTFNAHSSGAFLDASPNGFSLTNANNYALVASPYDSAAVFTGASGYLSHASATALTIAGTGKMTFEARVYMTQYPSTSNTGGFTVLAGTYEGIRLQLESDGSFSAGGQKVSGGTGYWYGVGSSPNMVPLNRWVDLAIAYDNSNGQAYAYIDGTPVQLYAYNGNTINTDLWRTSTSAFCVGGVTTDNEPFNGKIDEIRVSNNLVLGAGLPLVAATPPTVPANLSYSSNPATYTVSVPITNNTPTVSGAVTKYSVTPALPAGLKLDSTTGIISGTPTTVSAATNYTVLAANSAGFTTATVNITVVTPSPPSGLTYPKNPAIYGVDVTVTPNNPTVSGTAPITYMVTPALPAGLALNATIGTISGTPTIASAAAYYIVTATNNYGNTSASVNITVIAAPSGLSYSANPAQYAVGTAITPNTPAVTGAVTGYSVSPALPAGLTLNPTTGVITGTPTAEATAANYTVTATNAQGSTATVTVNIVVRLAPSNLTYSNNPALYLIGTAINPNLSSIQGTSPFTYSVSPALPPGLSLNTSTGAITGTPTTTKAAANYVITATNPAGSTTATLVVATATGVFQLTDSRMLTLRLRGSSAMAFSIPANAESGRLEVFDMQGMKVSDSRVEFGNDASSLFWDGKSNGHSVSGGIYFARVSLFDMNQRELNTISRKILYTP